MTSLAALRLLIWEVHAACEGGAAERSLGGGGSTVGGSGVAGALREVLIKG